MISSVRPAGRPSQTATPPVAGVCLAQWLRIFANVRVGAHVTVTGTPTPLSTAVLISRHVVSTAWSGGMRKHSSMLYAPDPPYTGP